MLDVLVVALVAAFTDDDTPNVAAPANRPAGSNFSAQLGKNPAKSSVFSCRKVCSGLDPASVFSSRTMSGAALAVRASVVVFGSPCSKASSLFKVAT